MKNTSVQTALPGTRDWREPQVVSAQRLASMITEGNAAGFDAIRMECWRNPFGYRVTFQRMPDANACREVRSADSFNSAMNQSA